LAVYYKPLAGPSSQVSCLIAVEGSELFLQVSEGEILLSKRERERKKVLKDIFARYSVLSWWVFCFCFCLAL
jgi:hypothetical protein